MSNHRVSLRWDNQEILAAATNMIQPERDQDLVILLEEIIRALKAPLMLMPPGVPLDQKADMPSLEINQRVRITGGPNHGKEGKIVFFDPRSRLYDILVDGEIDTIACVYREQLMVPLGSVKCQISVGDKVHITKGVEKGESGRVVFVNNPCDSYTVVLDKSGIAHLFYREDFSLTT